MEGTFVPQLRWLHLTGTPPQQHHSNSAELLEPWCEQHHPSWLKSSCWEGRVVLVPPLARQEPAGAAVLPAGTHGRIPRPQLARHSWEERG